MNEDDADDEANAIGATRYPCMPSLVSLQQMRNRHHLAKLGEKLMKWTALATGRELRRITEDLNLAYANFGHDIRECYILLARSRYFYPNLNKMVIENVPNQARIRASSLTKTVAGVKVLQYQIIDTGCQPYQHLAIEQGGQIVKDAKDAWLELLKRMIMILQLREAFKQVHEANRNATKRQNVLSRTVIPRVLSSIHYIILELEELAREELYRIKKVVEFKKKKKEKLLEKAIAEVPKVIFTDDDLLVKTTAEVPKAIFTDDVLLVKTTAEVPKVIFTDDVLLVKTTAEVPKVIFTDDDLPVKTTAEVPKVIFTDDDLLVKTTAEVPKVIFTDDDSQSTENTLIEQLSFVLYVSKELMTSQIRTIDFGYFLKHCEKVKERMSKAFQSEKPLKLSEVDSKKQGHIDDDLIKLLEHLKSHLGSVIDISKEFREKVNISPSVEDFNNLCQIVYEKLDLYFQDIQSPKASGYPPEDKLECLKHINDTEELTHYKNQGIIASGSEKCLDACAHIISGIDSYKNDKNANKLQYLKDHVTDLEQLTTDNKENGMTSDSIEEFLLACKKFKEKIAQYKSEDRTPPSDGKITKLIDQINTAIEISNAAKESGLVSNSVQNFIQSCEDVKQRLEQKVQRPEQSTILRELQDSLEDVVNLIFGLQARGSITKSVETLLKTCLATKTKIDNNYGTKQTYDDVDNSDPEFLYSACNPTVSDCKNDPGISEKCEIWIEEASAASFEILPPCKECDESKSSTILPISENSKDSSCDKKPSIDETNSGSAEKITIASDQENLNVDEPPKVDSKIGLFEKKVKKIIKVTRTLNKDGTVKEEREETITEIVRHDPNETEFDNVLEQASKGGSEQS